MFKMTKYSMRRFTFSDQTKVVTTDEEIERTHKLDSNERERFSEYLIRKGVLSSKMMQQLQNEFLGESSQSTEPKEFEMKSKRKTNKRKTQKRK